MLHFQCFLLLLASCLQNLSLHDYSWLLVLTPSLSTYLQAPHITTSQGRVVEASCISPTKVVASAAQARTSALTFSSFFSSNTQSLRSMSSISRNTAFAPEFPWPLPSSSHFVFSNTCWPTLSGFCFFFFCRSLECLCVERSVFMLLKFRKSFALKDFSTLFSMSW